MQYKKKARISEQKTRTRTCILVVFLFDLFFDQEFPLFIFILCQLLLGGFSLSYIMVSLPVLAVAITVSALPTANTKDFALTEAISLDVDKRWYNQSSCNPCGSWKRTFWGWGCCPSYRGSSSSAARASAAYGGSSSAAAAAAAAASSGDGGSSSSAAAAACAGASGADASGAASGGDSSSASSAACAGEGSSSAASASAASSGARWVWWGDRWVWW